MKILYYLKDSQDENLSIFKLFWFVLSLIIQRTLKEVYLWKKPYY